HRDGQRRDRAAARARLGSRNALEELAQRLVEVEGARGLVAAHRRATVTRSQAESESAACSVGIGSSRKCVMRLHSAKRSAISSCVNRCTRSVPKSSTLKDASTDPYAIAQRTSASVISSPACAARKPRKPPANESPAPVGSITVSSG